MNRFAHEPPAVYSGLSQSLIDGIRTDTPPPISGAGEDENAIYAFCYQLYHGKHRVDQATWIKARELLGEKGCVELMGVMSGYWWVVVTHGTEAMIGVIETWTTLCCLFNSFVSMSLNVDEFPVPQDSPNLLNPAK